VWAALGTSAWAQEYREISVEGGFAFAGEVLATTGEGFRVRVPQGVLFVPFERVVDLHELAADTVLDPAPWTVVVVGAPAAVSALRLAYADVPAIRLIAPVEWPDPAQRAAAVACGVDLGCLLRVEPHHGPRLVVRGSVSGSRVDLVGRVPWIGGDVAVEVDVARDASSIQPFHAAALGAIALEAGGEPPRALALGWGGVADQIWGPAPPPAPVPPPQPSAPTGSPPVPAPAPSTPAAPPPHDASPWAGRKLGYAFLPFPGIPSLAQGRAPYFAGALLTAAASSAGWVALTGGMTTTRAEQIGLSVAGSYVLSVASSELFGLLGPGPRADVTAGPATRWAVDLAFYPLTSPASGATVAPQGLGLAVHLRDPATPTRGR
jgi:hypothetical protein